MPGVQRIQRKGSEEPCLWVTLYQRASGLGDITAGASRGWGKELQTLRKEGEMFSLHVACKLVFSTLPKPVPASCTQKLRTRVCQRRQVAACLRCCWGGCAPVTAPKIVSRAHELPSLSLMHGMLGASVILSDHRFCYLRQRILVVCLWCTHAHLQVLLKSLRFEGKTESSILEKQMRGAPNLWWWWVRVAGS